ncbi:MAG: ROK family protein [Candidatus Marinimicrobia bacterium]|nr:ROK family protein [Candidatus Neomarinimicrobiota bacterium]MCF7921857.1 ROK family protein [Candidatus Neomarinimicrobiota bacterium]
MDVAQPGNTTSDDRSEALQLIATPRKKEIVKYLFYESSATLKELAELLKITFPTAAKLIEELQQENVVLVHDESRSSGGRRSAQYHLNPQAGYILCVDSGRLNTKLAIMNLGREILAHRNFRSPVFKGDNGFIPLLKESVFSMLEETGVSMKNILGLGVGIPGFVDSESGISYSFLNYFDKPISITLSETFGLPVVIANDVNLMAHAEHHFGLAKNAGDALIINLGWGIGMGFILNNEVYMGGNGFAGEFGHIQVDPDGVPCHCGKYGCLETVASGEAISRIAIQRLKNGEKSLLAYDYADDLSQITARKIVNVAKEGDEFSIRLLQESGESIGRCLAIVMQILNPKMIILGGKHSHAGRLITNSLEKCITQYTNPKIAEDVVIVQSDLGDASNLLGAAGLVIEKIVCAEA